MYSRILDIIKHKHVQNAGMLTNKTVIFSSTKQGHHDNYAKLVNYLMNARIVDKVLFQCFLFFVYRKIIFIDFDKSHLMFGLFSPLRRLFHCSDVYISVRSEFILNKTIAGFIKRIVHKIVLVIGRGRIVSIHKGAENKALNQYISDYIYDIQAWDLPILNIPQKIPKEITKDCFNKSLLVVLGSLNEKRCKGELIDYLTNKEEKTFYCIIAGKMDPEDENKFMNVKDTTVINRYLSDGEMMYLYSISNAVYCYYDASACRPSGILGRTIQFRKIAIVRDGGFLHSLYQDYSGLRPIPEIEGINKIMSNISHSTFFTTDKYNDSKTLFKILSS